MKTETKVETTPGPWEEGVMKINYRKDDENYRFIKAGVGFLSDTGSGFSLTGYISPADSRMISAAPDMLKALEEVNNYLHQRTSGKLAKRLEVLSMSAIKKARGL